MGTNTWGHGAMPHLLDASKCSCEEDTVRLVLVVPANITRENIYHFCLGHSVWISGRRKSVDGLCSPGIG